MGPYTKKLRETLTGIQMGEIEGPEGWVQKIMEFFSQYDEFAAGCFRDKVS